MTPANLHGPDRPDLTSKGPNRISRQGQRSGIAADEKIPFKLVYSSVKTKALYLLSHEDFLENCAVSKVGAAWVSQVNKPFPMVESCTQIPLTKRESGSAAKPDAVTSKWVEVKVVGVLRPLKETANLWCENWHRPPSVSCLNPAQASQRGRGHVGLPVGPDLTFENRCLWGRIIFARWRTSRNEQKSILHVFSLLHFSESEPKHTVWSFVMSQGAPRWLLRPPSETTLFL